MGDQEERRDYDEISVGDLTDSSFYRAKYVPEVGIYVLVYGFDEWSESHLKIACVMECWCARTATFMLVIFDFAGMETLMMESGLMYSRRNCKT